MKRIIAAAILCWLAVPAFAQNAIVQEGAVSRNAPTMFSGDRKVRQGATVAGAPTGRIVTTGDAVVGGRCDYSAPTDTAGGYQRLCLDAANGRITLDGTKSALPSTVTLNVGGTDYQLPGSAAVVGSDAAVANNAALKLLVGTVGKRILRLGSTTAGDGGAASYIFSATNCTLSAGAGDNGSQVAPTTGGGCWNADFSVIPVNVKQFGAKGDCVTDDGAAFTAAFATGRPVYAPSGHYLISTGGTYSTIPIKLFGDGYEEYGLAQGNICDLTKKGTYIVTKNVAVTPFTLNGPNIRGSSFSNIGVLQDHAVPGVGWAASAYLPTWVLVDTLGSVNFSGIGLGGVNKVVDATGNSARVFMDDIRGQVFGFLLRTEALLDLSRADNVHLWVYWSGDSNVLKYQLANTDYFYFRRQDGFQADNVFLFGARSCVRLSTWMPGGATAIHFSSLNCDAAKYAIWADSTSQNTVMSVSHLWFGGEDETLAAPVAGGNAIQIDGANATINIGDINVLLTAQSVVNQTNVSLGSQVNIERIANSGFSASGWNYSGGTAFAGTFPVIRDASPVGGESVYSIGHPVQPQNAGANADGGLSSGIINAASNANLFMASEDQAWRLQVVTNGGIYVVPNWTSTYILNGIVAGVTVKLPKSPLDGKLVTLTCDNTITTLTVAPDDFSTFTVLNPPTTCTPGQTFRFRANLAGTPVWRTLK